MADMRKLLFLTVASAVLVGFGTEISWSVMHPTAIDVAYMKRVVEKAKEYGDVDSFEVCGDCHSPYGGINGLSTLDPYPHAHAQIDPKLVEKSRAEMNAICELAHSIGKPLYYWHREVFLAKGLLEDHPEMLDENGEFDLLGKAYQDYLRFKLQEAFRHCPKLDGVVLTLTEADYSVIHSSNPKRYPPQRVVEELVGIFAEEHEKLGKRFILRSFGSNAQDYTDIIGGAKRAAARHAFEIETKVTEADFVPWLPKNPFLKKNPPLTLGAECDALGEYLSAGYLPAAQVGRIREYVASGREEGVDRYTIRIDRVGNSIFDSAHEVNLYAYMRFVRDPKATVDQVIGEYAAKRFGAAAPEMVPLVRDELEMIRNIHYVASNLVFHSFPLKPDFKWLKSGGIFSVYREDASLADTKDIWSLLSWMRTPSHAQVLAEKERGLAQAERSLARLEALKGRLPAEEYERQHRAFAKAVKAAKALQAFTKCCVAYFEDMKAKRDVPAALEREVKDAVRVIESQMTDVKDDFTGKGTYFAVVGENLDRVYFIGLRFYCRELLNEYRLERAMRRKYERPDVCDFVIPGGIYDDNRTIRTMHGAHAVTKADRVVRYAGNDVFPNGTVTVRLRAPKDAQIGVDLDAEGAKECALAKTWKDGEWTVVVGKRGGKLYPGVLAVWAKRPASAGKAGKEMTIGEFASGVRARVVRKIREALAAGRSAEVSGVVTYAGKGLFFLQKDDDGLKVLCKGAVPRTGDTVTVTGSPSLEGGRVVFVSAKWKKTGTEPVPAARAVTRDDLVNGDDAKGDVNWLRVALEGRAIGVTEQGFAVNVDDVPVNVMVSPLPDFLKACDKTHPKVKVTGVAELMLDQSVLFGGEGYVIGVKVDVAEPSDIVLDADLAYLAACRDRTFTTVAVALVVVLAVGLLAFAVIVFRQRRGIFRTRTIMAERKRMADDIHDTIEQHLVGAGMLLKVNRLKEAQDVLVRAKAELRDIIWGLKNDDMMRQTPAEMLRQLAHVENTKGLYRVDTSLKGLPEHLEAAEMRDLSLIVRETIGNAVKHGGAKKIAISGEPLEKGGWLLRISNDGAPFDPETAPGAKEGHFGIEGMKQRGRRLGATVTIERRGKGMVLNVERRNAGNLI